MAANLFRNVLQVSRITTAGSVPIEQQPIVLPPRQDVDVQMWDCLPGHVAIRLNKAQSSGP